MLRRCRLQGAGHDDLGVVCNLSTRGAYVAVQPAPKVGTQIQFSFQLPWEDASMTIDAVVCWDNSDRKARGLPPGCGLEFLAPNRPDQLRIEALVRTFRPQSL